MHFSILDVSWVNCDCTKASHVLTRGALTNSVSGSFDEAFASLCLAEVIVGEAAS